MNTDFINQILSYNPETGEFFWKNGTQKRTGAVSGSPNNNGYFRVMIKGKRYLLHHLAWFLSYGEWPIGQIDHRNRIRTDNRLCNLRLAGLNGNPRNSTRYRNNTSGKKGVSWHKGRMKFQAYITVNRKKIYLGLFCSAAAAADAYDAASARLHGEFSSPNN